jgi:hypothetical protein
MASQFLTSLMVLMPLTLAAQSLQERIVVPLNNWPAPPTVRRSKIQAQQRVVTPKLLLPGSATADPLIFVPIAPCRVADTRPGSGYPALGSTPLAPLTPLTLPVAGTYVAGGPATTPCGISVVVDAEAYSLNVTAVPPSGTAGGYLLVYPNPVIPIPLVASLTWNPGASYQTNAVISAASADGSVNVVANSTTDVVVDINGYYAAPTDLSQNTAMGSGALNSALGGPSGSSNNTAFGYMALYSTTDGGDNTAVGGLALSALNGATGLWNAALGSGALQNLTDGEGNVAIGYNAGGNLTTGAQNIIIGFQNGQSNLTTGSSNILIGGGGNLPSSSYNIMIGNVGGYADNNTIRIGNGQTATYIAGILGNTLSSASPVVINANGQLGIEGVSSRRYKEDIHEMGDASTGLLRLRPVTFHYKKPEADGSKPLEYGLIAEEVAGVYPELVIRGADGQVESVQYAKLPAMLLNELQKQYRHTQDQDRTADQQARRIQQQDETIKKLEARLAALEAQSSTTAKLTSDKTLPSSAGGR